MPLPGRFFAALVGLLAHQVTTSPTPTVIEPRQATVADRTIFSPPSNAGWVDPRVLYARAIQTRSGALLATWENYSPEPPIVYFPVYRSTDDGSTWTEIGRVRDTVNSWGLRYQPYLYELPSAIGAYPAGTLLLAGNSIPTNLSKTKIDVYASTDGGVTWSFVSSVASGGEARPTNGLTPIWEPLLMVYNNQLVCYYSDQRDSKYGQKLVHQTTTDLRTWGAAVDDVHDSAYSSRPGMPAVAKLPNGNYIFAYELCGTDGCRVHYRLGSDPLNILAAPSYSLVSTAGNRLVSSPSVVWSSVGGANGTIVLSGGSSGSVYVNRALGASGAWVEHTTPQPAAYSRGLSLYQSDPDRLIIIGAGKLPPSTTNKVSVSVVSLSSIVGS